jgi:hypothetical protein
VYLLQNCLPILHLGKQPSFFVLPCGFLNKMTMVTGRHAELTATSHAGGARGAGKVVLPQVADEIWLERPEL